MIVLLSKKVKNNNFLCLAHSPPRSLPRRARCDATRRVAGTADTLAAGEAFGEAGLAERGTPKQN